MDTNSVTSTNFTHGEKKRASCRPPVNTTYLVIGQDLFSINEYILSQYNYSLHHYLSTKNVTNFDATEGNAATPIALSHYVPSAFMVYSDLASLKGLWEPTDYGSGVEYADGLLSLFPPNHYLDNYDATKSSKFDASLRYSSTGLQIGLWLNGSQGCYSIYNEQLDHQIQLLISYLESCRASKVFIRVGYEFDNPAFGYSDDPSMFILAFRKIVSDCREFLSKEANERVYFVWHSWGAPMASEKLSLARFYPGDKYVDWVGVSIFQQLYPWSVPEVGTLVDVENVLKFAHQHKKPTMIAESTPFGGIELKQATVVVQKAALDTYRYDGDTWNLWFGKVVNIIDMYDISMWCYINADWENLPMWHNVGFGETRLSTNEIVMSKWQELIMRDGVPNRKFLMAGSLENCGNPIDAPDIKDDLLGDSKWKKLTHIGNFIVIPFLLVGAVFYIPYFILGGHKPRHCTSKNRERQPLLSRINQPTSFRVMKSSSDV